MEHALKLQEVRLIKDSKIQEALRKRITESTEELEKAVEYAKSVLYSYSGKTDNDDEMYNWYLRLSKKIETLEISHTVSLQSQAQLKLMFENNTQLIDKIIDALTVTIPIWRNQVTMLLGVERLNRDLEAQNRMSEIARERMSDISKLRSRDNNGEIDVGRLSEANEKLKKLLDELAEAERKGADIRLELNNILA